MLICSIGLNNLANNYMKLLTLTKLVLSMTLLLSISLNAENTIYAKFETPQVTITGNADDPAISVSYTHLTLPTKRIV